MLATGVASGFFSSVILSSVVALILPAHGPSPAGRTTNDSFQPSAFSRATVFQSFCLADENAHDASVTISCFVLPRSMMILARKPAAPAPSLTAFTATILSPFTNEALTSTLTGSSQDLLSATFLPLRNTVISL